MTSIKRSQHSYLQTAGFITGGTTLLLGLLALKYPERPIFAERHDELPYPGGYPLVGMALDIMKNKETIHCFFLQVFENLNTLTWYGRGIGMPRSVVTIDPRNIEHILKSNFENYVKGPMLNDSSMELLGHGIFNSNGDVWRYQRKTASHIFNVKNFRDNFTKTFIRHIRYMNEHIFDLAAESGHPLDFHDIMYKFTLDSFVELSFGEEVRALATKDKVPFASSFDACQLNVAQRFVNPMYKLTEPLTAWFMPWRTSLKHHLAVIDDFAFGVIDKRRQDLAMGQEYGDLLSRFMTATNVKNEQLSNKELRDVVLNFVIAGRDTTAQALSWTFYCLLTDPRVEHALLEEVNLHITDDLENDPAALYEVIKGMKYANANPTNNLSLLVSLKEVLRLYPSVPENQKYALNEDILPDGTRVKKNDYVIWCPWSQGRSTKIWGEDAKEFKPERWITDENDLRNEPAAKWTAFHAGRQNLATLEALVAIVCLLRRYTFELLPDQDITYQYSLTLPMKNGMKIYVHHRRDRTMTQQ
ncbi:hypothetical protein [Absidia glauca]|uniref:Cytochrome P450 n=1 Tax=Absidia glauca TaxID=4829 RepID=A0A163IRG7_ABSGL|nr:hypothetical protein [Absidia glauca]